MTLSRAMIGTTVLVVAALVAGHGASAQRLNGLPAECVTPKLRMCMMMDVLRRECSTAAMQEMPDKCRKAISERAALRAGALLAGWREVSFGSHPRQKIDWLVPEAAGKAPLLLFVHGGGWAIGDKRLGADRKGAYFAGPG